MGTRLVAGAAASALALALYARVEQPWVVLGWVAFVPWLAALDRTPSMRAALGGGLLFSAAFVLAVFGWLVTAAARYTGAPVPVALAAIVLASPLLQPQLVVHAAARRIARRVLPGFWLPVLAAAALYVGVEWASGKVCGDTVGHGLHASAWLRQAADLGGAHGLTFVLLVVNECVLAAVRAPAPGLRWRRGLAAAALPLALCAYGALRIRQLAQAPTAAPLSAGIVQADLGDYERLRSSLGTFDAVGAILDAHVGLSAELLRRGGLDLLVWPETVYPTTFGAPKSPEGAAFDEEIGAFVAGAGVPLVLGTYAAQAGAEFNAAVFLRPVDGRLERATYLKARLFPLTERVPAVLDRPLVRRWFPWLGTWHPGRGPDVVALALRDGRTVPIAPLICYDAVDPRLALGAVGRGAEVILTLSNDGWFASGLGPRLHLVVSAFRSIETRRPQIRATNTGISAVIDATGELGATAGVHERATVVATVRPARATWTLLLAWGDWFGPTALASGLGLLGAGWLRRRRRANRVGG